MRQHLQRLHQKPRLNRPRQDRHQPDAARALPAVPVATVTPELTTAMRLARAGRVRGVRGKFAFLLASVMLSWLASPPVWSDGIADAGDLSDFIVNIARYTSWPGDLAKKGLTVCFAHGGALAAPATSATSGDPPREVKGLPVTWRQITAPAQLPGCNIVWLNADVRPAPGQWLLALHDQPILTLSNYADFTADGGIIGAYRLGGEWRFEVSLEALQRSRLNISAVALRLSQRARPKTATGESR